MSKNTINSWKSAWGENTIMDTGVHENPLSLFVSLSFFNKYLAAHTHPSPSCGRVEAISSEWEPG